MLLLLLNYVVLSALWKKDVYLISTKYWCRRKKQNLSIKLFKKLLELKLKVYKNLPKTESDKGIDQFQIFELFSNSAL